MLPTEIRDALDGLLALGDIAGAATQAEIALANGFHDPMLFNLAAWKAEEVRDFVRASALLEAALKLAPDDPYTLIGLGSLWRKQGRNGDAIRVLGDAIARLQDNGGAWLERAYAFEGGGMLDAAAGDYAQATALDPAMAPAWAGRANVAGIQSDTNAARNFAARALAIDADCPMAHIALMRCDLAEGNAEAARATGDALRARADLPAADRFLAMGFHADALHRLGNADAAFAAYAATNMLFLELHGPGPPGGQRAFINRLNEEVAETAEADWAPHKFSKREGDPDGHVFLVGYPRSGTTLVETILATVPDVETLEERPTFLKADNRFLEPPGGVAALAKLSADDNLAFREDYWNQVRTFGVDVTARTFVDMDPLKTIKLPLIARLFPEARIVIMRRDPRDVVWSCFHTSFVPTAAARAFASLEETARHYDALMRYADVCVAKLGLEVFELRYDRLIADFDGATQALCAYLGLPWSAGIRNFHETGKRRTVTTASIGQVRQRLFDGGGQWRRYAAQLEPVMPILKPWIERFGVN
jgi:tetratricopeptide (TPR) repeat protein